MTTISAFVRKITVRRAALGLALVVVLFAMPLVVFADQVVNTLDSTVDPALEEVTITAGGSAVVGFYVLPSNTIPAGDANGCNATGSNPASATLSVPSGVTASSSTITFVGCENERYVTFSSNTVGEYTISIASMSGGKSGSGWDTAPAAFTLKVVAATPSDSTPPVITPSVSGTMGNNGWYTSDVTVTWTVEDPESAISSQTGCNPTVINYDTAGVTLTCEATSAGGTSSESVTIKRDATAPLVSVTGVSQGAQYTLGSVPAAGCDTTDTTSGVATVAGLTLSGGNANGVGAFTATCSGAEDNAGNLAAPVSVGYSVIYSWAGFFQPVDNNALNVAKAGSAIPVKFSLAGNQGLNIFAAGYPRSVVISCDTNQPTDVIDETMNAGQSSLSYDATADQYIYVWKTEKSWATKCRQLQVMLNDDKLYTANFRFK